MISRILVPIDGSRTAERGLREALALAAPLKARLVLLTVVDDYPLLAGMATAAVYEESRRLMLDRGRQLLQEARAVAEAQQVPVETVLREVTTQGVADAIVEEARERRCDLVVMGTHGRRGLTRLALGSDAELVLRDAPVPVMLVRHADL